MGRGVVEMSQQETVDKIYQSLTRLIADYTDQAKQLSDITVDVDDMDKAVTVLEEFIEKHCADAVMGGEVWQHTAKLYKERAEELRLQIKLLTDAGHKFDIEIPIKAAVVE
jgi:hypothetical protein